MTTPKIGRPKLWQARINLRIDPRQVKALDKKAAKMGIDRTAAIRTALDRYIKAKD